VRVAFVGSVLADQVRPPLTVRRTAAVFFPFAFFVPVMKHADAVGQETACGEPKGAGERLTPQRRPGLVVTRIRPGSQPPQDALAHM
jgi:hypothetical protein